MQQLMQVGQYLLLCKNTVEDENQRMIGVVNKNMLQRLLQAS